MTLRDGSTIGSPFLDFLPTGPALPLPLAFFTFSFAGVASCGSGSGWASTSLASLEGYWTTNYPIQATILPGETTILFVSKLCDATNEHQDQEIRWTNWDEGTHKVTICGSTWQTPAPFTWMISEDSKPMDNSPLWLRGAVPAGLAT